jgi:hypothetical protein
MSTPIPDLYQVKWGLNRYGIACRYSPESIAAYNDYKKVLVDDAVTTGRYLLPVANLIPIPTSFDPPDEYKQYVDEQYKIAKARSDSLPAGAHVGKLFRVPAADGYAYYVVTKANKKTVHIEWRGFSLDRWVDYRFGAGGKEDKELIERLIKREEGLAKLFVSST